MPPYPQIESDLQLAKLPQTIIFYDGECGMCDRFVTFCLKWDQQQNLNYAPLQGTTAKTALPQKLVENIQSVVCLDQGEIFTHSSAVIRVLWKLQGFWSFCGSLLYFMPRVLRDFGYRLIARYRYLIMGKKTSCRLISPSERLRFLP
jgi:predicted DCC family thiol-disulfide oxidoreductase YuxK